MAGSERLVRYERTLMHAALICTAHAFSCNVLVDPTESVPASLAPGAHVAQTLAEAQQHMRALIRSGASAAGSSQLTVCVAPGTYRESLAFSELDSAPPGSRIVWRALQPGSVSITGGVPVSFQPIQAGDPGLAYLSPAAAAAVVVASLPAAGVSDYGVWNVPRSPGFFGGNGCASAPLELIYGDVPQRVARWPNPGEGPWVNETDPRYTWARTDWRTWDSYNGSFWANSNNPVLRDTANLYVHAFPWWEWADGFYRVADWDTSSGLVTLAPPLPTQNFSGAARYVMLNALDALDQAGEYYVNTTSGALYFWPPMGADQPVTGVVTVNDTAVTASNLHNVSWLGVTFEALRGTAFQCLQCTGIQIVNVTVKNTGNGGFDLYACADCIVSGVNGTQLGSFGVSFVGGGNRATLQPSGNLIVDTVITQSQRVCHTYNPALAIDSGGAMVHSEAHDTPHFCATLQGNDVVVSGSRFSQCTQASYDNACLYWFPGDWTKYNVSVQHNLFDQCGSKPMYANVRTSPVRGSVYGDNTGAGWRAENNVIWQPLPLNPPCSAPGSPTLPCNPAGNVAIINDGGRLVSVSNNIVVDALNLTLNSAGMLTWDEKGHTNGSSYYLEMDAVNWNTGVYAERYPDLAALDDFVAPDCPLNLRCPAAPYNNTLKFNVAANVSALMVYPPADNPFPRSGFDVGIQSNYMAQDPGWANADPRATLDFGLAANSPAFQMGFTNFSTNCFGAYKRCPEDAEPGMAHLLARVQQLMAELSG